MKFICIKENDALTASEILNKRGYESKVFYSIEEVIAEYFSNEVSIECYNDKEGDCLLSPRIIEKIKKNFYNDLASDKISPNPLDELKEYMQAYFNEFITNFKKEDN